MLKLSVRIDAPSVNGPIEPAGDIPEANIWRDSGGSVSAFLFHSADKLGICFPKFASYIFPEAELSQGQMQIVIEPAATATREQVIDRLARNVVPLLLQSRGIQVLHASAIRLQDGVVGLCGPSFSGKSTLAYALAKRGYDVWADDALLISVKKGDILTLKDPSVRLRLRPDSRKYFGEFDKESLATTGDDDELELCLSKLRESPLKALCLIHRSPEQGLVWSCNSITGHLAFTQILRQANYFKLADMAEHRRISETCLNVACNVPIYSCRYRDGFDFIEDVVAEIESYFAPSIYIASRSE